MKKKRLSFCLCYLITTILHAQDVQQNFLDSLSGKFISEIRSQGRPKALLVTDKSIFKAGESIWFRGFLLNSASQKVTSKSKYLFVDLVNEGDSLISSVLLDAASQQLNTMISLPADMPSGYYWLRAYTRQMANGDTNNAFVKPVYVIGSKVKSALKTTNSKSLAGSSDPVMKFYPEGGSVITGANCTIAFLIRDAEGRAIATEGYIKDTRDSIAARFTSDKAGLGKFDLSASFFRKYKAYINWNGKQISYPLPPFNLYAGQIAVTKQAGGNRVLRVLLEDSIYKRGIVTYVIGISKDSLCFAAIGHGQYELAVPEQKFPEGIATFFLFDNNGKFLSERSIYVKESNVIVQATTDKNIYSKREKVSLNISVFDANHHPVPSLLSVSVADSAFVNSADENVLPDLSNSGLIDNSAIAPLRHLTDEYLDVIMLLKNNTYVNRTNSAVKNTSDFYDSLLFVKGKAMDEKDRPASNKILTLFSNSGITSFLTDTTDNAGQFSFPVYDYADSTQFAIEARNLNTSTANIKIVREPLTFPKFSTPVSLKHYFQAEPVFTNKYRNAYLDSSGIVLGKEWLQRVTVTGKRKAEAGYNEALRVSPSSTIVGPDQLDERRSVSDILLNIGGLHMLQGFLVINGPTAMRAPDASSEPLLVVDGIETQKVGVLGESPLVATLNSINPKDIDFIEVLKGPEGSNYGMRGGNGVILINLVHTRRQNFNINPGNLQTFYVKGISKPSVFPMVNYDNKQFKSTEYFDNRSTIFWNGNTLTGAENSYNLHFFTSDVPTAYKVTVSGITVHGDLIYKTLIFQNK